MRFLVSVYQVSFILHDRNHQKNGFLVPESSEIFIFRHLLIRQINITQQQ